MFLLVVAMAAIALTATPATACCFTSDPNDTSGKLDSDVAGGEKADANAPLKLRLNTFARWPSDLLAKRR